MSQLPPGLVIDDTTPPGLSFDEHPEKKSMDYFSQPPRGLVVVPQSISEATTGEEVAALINSKKSERGFNGVPGAAPTRFLAPDGTPISRREWRSLNEPTPPRGLVMETGAALVRGVVEAPKEIAKALTTPLGINSQDVEDTLPSGPQSSRSDTLGRAANMIGGFAPTLLEGPVGFGTQAFNQVYERTENLPASLAAGIAATGLGMIPAGNLMGNTVVKGLVEKYGETATQRFLLQRLEGIATGASNVGIAATTEGIARGAGASPQDFDVLDNFLAGYVGHEVLALPRTIAEYNSDPRMKTKLVNQKLLTPAEVKLIGTDQKLVADVALRRIDGEKVRVEAVNGKSQVISEGRDPVPWKVQEALDFNPVAIEFERERIVKGGQPIFIEPSRLPPSKGEVSEVVARLTKLWDSIKLEPTDQTVTGQPATQRALYVQDLTNQITKLSQQPSRLYVQQGEALENAAGKLKNSVEPIPARVAETVGQTPEIHSPIDMRPTQKFFFPLVGSDARGYFKPPEELSKSPSVQSKIATIQRRSMERISALRESADMTPDQKVIVTKALDADHQAKMEDMLGKDSAKSRTKAQLAADVARSGKTDKRKIEAMAVLDHVFESIAKHTQNEDVKGLLDRVRAEIKDQPPEIREILGKGADQNDLTTHLAYDEYLRRSTKGEAGTPESDYARAEQRLKRALVDVTEKGQRDQIIKSLSGLKPELSKPFLESLRGVKSPADLASLASAIEVARQVEQRKADVSRLKEMAGQIEKNPQRKTVEKLLGGLTPEPKAQGKLPPEKAVRAAIVFDGKTYRAQGDEIIHASMWDRIVESLPKDKQAEFWKVAQSPEVARFETNHGRIVSGEEAQKINRSVSPTSLGVLENVTAKEARTALPSPSEGATKPVGGSEGKVGPVGTPKETAGKQGSTVEVSKKSPSPVLVSDPKTGKRSVDTKALEKALDKLMNDQVTNLANQVKQVIRQGNIEKGLYNKYLGYSTADNVRKVSQNILSSPLRKPLSQRFDKQGHVTGLVFDPVTIEGLLAQRSGFDLSKSLYKIFVGDMTQPYNNHLQNKADTRRFLTEVTKRTLGFDFDSLLGRRRLGKYLLTPIDGQFTRGEAMHAYALAGDEGRGSDLKEFGYRKNGVVSDPESLIKKLSVKEKAFVDEMKSYFQNNPFVEKTFSEFLLQNGYEPQRFKGWWASSRKPQESAPTDDFATFTTSIARDTDNLKDREDNLNTPFEARDFVGHFMQVADRMSMFGEMGRQLRQAQDVLYHPDVVSTFNSRYGKASYDQLKMFLSNIHGRVGHQPSAFDEAINYATTAYTVSKIALNTFSAAKQFLHIATMYADGNIGKAALTKSILTGAFASKETGQSMLDNNGIAYLRYHGHFLEDLTTLSEQNQLPSRLQELQNYSLILQREADRAVMKIAWRAAEITARESGLTDIRAREEAVRLFNITAGRDQPTSNPLYASELEIQAKRQPLLRGTLMFMREQNRIYNVIRRRVVESVQNPTPETVGQAANAIVFGLIGNAVGIVGINALRRAAFNKAQDEKDVLVDAMDAVTGMFYLGSTAQVIAEFFISPKNVSADRLSKSPEVAMGKDLINLISHMSRASQAGSTEIKTGLHRGESKSEQEYLKAADSAFSLLGGVSGLPFWGLWYYSRNLYNWKHPDYKLMVEFEQKRAQLKADNRMDSLEYQELEQTRKRIDQIHQLRSKGLATQSESEKEILRELERAVR